MLYFFVLLFLDDVRWFCASVERGWVCLVLNHENTLKHCYAVTRASNHFSRCAPRPYHKAQLHKFYPEKARHTHTLLSHITYIHIYAADLLAIVVV